MKKKLTWVTIITLAVLYSCSSEEKNPAPKPGEPVQVTIRMERAGYSAPSRATGPNVETDKPVEVKNGMLYFVNGSNGQITNPLVVIPPNSEDEADNETIVRYDELISSGGVTLKNIDSRASYVYFVGNTPSELIPLPTDGHMDNVLAKEAKLTTQVDRESWGIGNVSLFGASPVDDGKVALGVEPIMARIQIPKLVMGGEITGFKLVGIFLNNFYHCTPLYGMPDEWNLVTYGSSDPFEPNSDEENPTYFSPSYEGIVYDWNDEEGLGGIRESGSTDYYPNGGDNWGFNVVGGDEIPHIIFVFTDITATEESGLTYSGRHYLTVRGFTDSATGGGLQSIQNGKIYIFNDGIIIDEEHLSSDPESGPDINTDAPTGIEENPFTEIGVGPVY